MGWTAGTTNHPDRLLVGGLLGPRRGGKGSQLGRAPVETQEGLEGSAESLGKKGFLTKK